MWWQVLGSNQRRRCRRIYNPLPLATRATCRGTPIAVVVQEADYRSERSAAHPGHGVAAQR